MFLFCPSILIAFDQMVKPCSAVLLLMIWAFVTMHKWGCGGWVGPTRMWADDNASSWAEVRGPDTHINFQASSCVNSFDAHSPLEMSLIPIPMLFTPIRTGLTDGLKLRKWCAWNFAQIEELGWSDGHEILHIGQLTFGPWSLPSHELMWPSQGCAQIA